MNIGQQIRQQREQRHWSQTDLSKKISNFAGVGLKVGE